MHSQEREREREKIDTATFSPNPVPKLDLLGPRGRALYALLAHGWPGGKRGEWCTALHLFQNSREEIRIPSPQLPSSPFLKVKTGSKVQLPLPPPCVTRLRSPDEQKEPFSPFYFSSRVMVERGKNDFKKGAKSAVKVREMTIWAYTRVVGLAEGKCNQFSPSSCWMATHGDCVRRRWQMGQGGER